MDRKIRLLIAVALCAFTGSAADRPLPFDPLNPYGPPTQPDLSKYGAGTEPIMSFLQSFMAGRSELKFEEYNDRIRNDDEDYEAYICRGFTRLTSLSENNEVVILVSKFGFRINDEYGTINFSPISNFDFDEELRKNKDIDAACEKALPVMEAALADFEKVPKNWLGAVDFMNDLDEKVSFDYADTLVARAAISEMISVLYFMKGYNTVAADMTTKPIDLEALAEAQRWMKRAAELVNAFAIAEDARTDYYKNYFFNLNPIATRVLRENARNLVDVSHWTVRIDLVSLSPFFFLTGKDQTEGTKIAKRESKRETLNGIGTLDVTLRNVFEGKLSAGNGTFPELCQGYPLVDMSLPDPTFAGTFPGISRTTLAELLSALADERVLGDLPSNPDEKIAHYGVLYKLPEGAENNPGNPATFAADMTSAIHLLNPTMAGYYFSGWSPSGEIRIETEETVEVTARFDPLQEIVLGEPIVCDTADEATNVAKKAVLVPRDDVAKVFGDDADAKATYCDMFTFGVVPFGVNQWAVEAVLKPEARTNVAESVQSAARQIPLADIAALPLGTPMNVTAKGCGVPGFYYSLYSGDAVTSLKAAEAEKNRNVLCGTDRDVKFSGVVKPSDAAGFFTIGVKETPGVQPSDRADLEPPARTDVRHD